MEIKGGIDDIAADVLLLINQVYKVVSKKDEECGKFFIEAIGDNLHFVTDDEELKKEAEKIREHNNKTIEEVDEMIGKLQKTKKMLQELTKLTE